LQKIAEYKAILADERLILNIIHEELEEIKEKYGDERRSEISNEDLNIMDEDLIPQEDVVITITHAGYIKRLPVTTYRSQKRGGRGVTGIETKENDFVEHLYVTNTHDYLMFFTNKGKVYKIKAYEVPELGRTAKGTPVINIIQIEPGETINAVIPVKDFDGEHFLFFATAQGVVKKTELREFIHIRKGGLIAITLRENDELIGVKLTDGNKEIIMGTSQGMSIRFSENDVRPMGRAATGVKGIELMDGDKVIDMDVVDENSDVLIVTAKGYGKRTPVSEYRLQTRGGKGIKTLSITQKNGPVVGLKVVSDEEDLMIITHSGTLIRTSISGISQMGRYTQGVKLIHIRNEDEVATVSKVEKSEEDSEQ
jgi:DNA gyrase subunit A